MKKRLSFLTLGLVALCSLASCKGTNEPSSSGSDSNNSDTGLYTKLNFHIEKKLIQSNFLTSMYFFYDEIIEGQEETVFYEYLYLDCINLEQEPTSYANREFVSFNIDLDKVYSENVFSNWNKELASEFTLTKEVVDNGFTFILRNNDGTSQTSNFLLDGSKITSLGDIYLASENNQTQVYYSQDSIPVAEAKPEIPNIDSFTFIYHRNNSEDYLKMGLVYFYSFDTTQSAVIKPNWTTVALKDKNNKIHYFNQFTIDFNTNYVGSANTWNFDSNSRVKLTSELLTGGIVVRNEQGDFKTSDIKPDYSQVQLEGSQKGFIYYLDRDEYEWKSDGEKVYEPGDCYYTTNQVLELLNRYI